MAEELPPREESPGAGEEAPAHAEEDPAHRDEGLELARVIARGLAGRTGPADRKGRAGPWSGPWSGQGPGQGAGRRAGHPKAGREAISGAHPDARDPQPLGTSLGRFVTEQGWETELRVHGVFTRWESVVGREVGQHVTPESYADGRLVVRTDSTAWATQMKLLAGSVVRRLNEELGDGTVQVIDVLGPRAPSWSRGRYRVKGRGPRDTYG